MTDQQLSDAFAQFGRNGRWGTCIDCPIAEGGGRAPELCKHTRRYDHQLTLEALREQWYYRHPLTCATLQEVQACANEITECVRRLEGQMPKDLLTCLKMTDVALRDLVVTVGRLQRL